MCFWKNWVAFSYLHSLCGPCAQWFYVSVATCNLAFSKFLQELPIYATSFCSLSLWCAAWSKYFARQSWTILEIISPSSSVIVYFGGDHCAFDFLRIPVSCIVGLLVPSGFCVMRFIAVSCSPSAGFYCSLVGWVVSFLPFWVLGFSKPPSIWVDLIWPILGFLGTRTCGGCVSTCGGPPSVVFHSEAPALLSTCPLS
jgi:hypothetical protein